jgi:pimeloyl-ACP methyl ester carboxylesterase
LHGFADTGSTFQFVVDEFRQDWFVVAPDWRGFGETASDVPAFWFPDYIADLDCLLQHYSPDAPVRLIGHSMGGNVAGLYAGAMPERVARFVNLEGFGLQDAKPELAPARYREWIERSRSNAVASEREDFAALIRAIRRRCPGMTLAQAGFVARRWATEIEDGRVRLHTNPAHKLPNPVLYRRAEAQACWRKVTADVLLVAGRLSEFGSPEKLPFPRRSIAYVEDAGHMLHFEQPAELARVIEEFLSKPNT